MYIRNAFIFPYVYNPSMLFVSLAKMAKHQSIYDLIEINFRGWVAECLKLRARPQVFRSNDKE